MTARLILKHPDSRLRIVSDDVNEKDWDENVAQWCQDIRDTMLANSGLGLAAPQIEIQKRIFAVNIKDLENPEFFKQTPEDGVLFFVNPCINARSRVEISSTEACLSVPGVAYKVKRSSEIDIAYTTLDRKAVSARVVGKDAIVFQHEFDHLNGKIFIDFLNPFDRKEFNKRFQVPKKKMTEGELKHLREQRRAKSRLNRKK